MEHFDMKNFVELFLVLNANKNKYIDETTGETIYMANISNQYEDIFNRVLKSEFDQDHHNQVIDAMTVICGRNIYLNNGVFEFNYPWFRDEMSDFAIQNHKIFTYDFDDNHVKVSFKAAEILNILDHYDSKIIVQMLSIIKEFSYFTKISEKEINKLMIDHHQHQTELLIAQKQLQKVLPIPKESKIYKKTFPSLEDRRLSGLRRK